MRKDAVEGGNEMMKFISYSHVDPKAAEEASKKSQGSGSPMASYNAGSLLAPGQNQAKMNEAQPSQD